MNLAVKNPLTAVEIARTVRTGKRSAREVLDEHIERIEANESQIHAFNEVTVDQAVKRAGEIDISIAAGSDPGLLAGVPVALKDNLCTRGIPTTCSSKILNGWLPPYNATVVDLLESAGAVIVGKTNMDEFAMGSSTENSAFGPSRNPRDITCVPGGSSGGSSASVTAGFAAVSLGSDTGGSIRQPASLCGVVGMKPTYGSVSRYGLLAFSSSLDQIGPFGHTVADTAVVYEVIAGHDARDSTSVLQPAVMDSAVLELGVKGLRVGVITELMGGAVEGISSDVVAQTQRAADALVEVGANVAEVSIPATIHGLAAYYLIAPAEASSNLSRYDGVRYGLRSPGVNVAEMNIATRTEGFGDEVKRRIMLGTFALSAGYYEAYYGKAQRLRTVLIRELQQAYQEFDVLLSPTSPCTAFRFGDKTNDPIMMYGNDVCTVLSNLSGHPAISVPFGVGHDGLPIGVQVLAPALGEREMFRTAAVLESLR